MELIADSSVARTGAYMAVPRQDTVTLDLPQGLRHKLLCCGHLTVAALIGCDSDDLQAGRADLLTFQPLQNALKQRVCSAVLSQSAEAPRYTPATELFINGQHVTSIAC